MLNGGAGLQVYLVEWCEEWKVPGSLEDWALYILEGIRGAGSSNRGRGRKMKRGKIEAWGGVVIPTQAKLPCKTNRSPILQRLQRLFSKVDPLLFGYLLMAAVLLVIGVEVML